ncbi:MAG: shikimate kinase [Planctomycetaceae bacterium]|nr:shikimate kinase [Planctomycetaceae bacterium]
MVITLIGYRGTGKSTVAAPLASRLGWDWLDADDVIEANVGKSIREIFAVDGEDVFRKHERTTMQALFGRDKLIIAAGGGAVLNHETRRDMQSAGPVIWLTASVDTILSRMQGDATTADRRPNLTNDGGRREVEQVLAIREPLYRECADIIISTEEKDVDTLVDEIMTELQPMLREGAAE